MSAQKRIVIIGGVAGGASAAARARRLSENAEIIMFERGKYISFANCGLPYHIEGTITDRDRLLVQTPKTMKHRFNIDVRIRTEITAIDSDRKEVTAHNLQTGEEYTEKYDALVLSPGAEPRRPPIPGADGERVFTLRSMDDMDGIKAIVDEKKPERAVVVGGGYIGLELTEALHERGVVVTLVELAPQVMISADPEMATPVKQQLRMQGIDLRLNTSITEIEGEDGDLRVVLSDGKTVACGLVLMSVGVRPETTLAQGAGVAIGTLGGIVTDEHMRTNISDIYAVGDAVEVTEYTGGFKALIPLAGPANRQGRIAADNIFGRESVYRKTQGTAICKVFNLTVAVTGLNEKILKKHAIPYEKIYVHPASHATYYPGASPISLKLTFDPENGKILGAQAVGGSGVDKRIDVVATAIRAGMTVYDLEHLELTYAPPYGSAKDPVNYAGFVAANALRGDVALCHYEDIAQPREDQYIVDVRTRAEVESGTIPGAHNIPVDDLRSKLDSLPRDKELLVTCQVGLRGYIACRILMQHGFACRNMTGGYKTWAMATDSLPEPEELPVEMTDDTGECEGVCHTPELTAEVVREVDATGLQCPGPILRLKTEMDSIPAGKALTIVVSDPGFVNDVPAWCKSTGNELVSVGPVNGNYQATIVKQGGKLSVPVGGSLSKKKTIVVFSSDFDRVMAAFIIANGAASMGSDVTLFFTFWGLNVLRKTDKVDVDKNTVEKMFGAMMPRGADKLSLSRMNMGGMGLKMMKDIMKKKNVNSLSELIGIAQLSGIQLVACTMTMEIMGIKKDELIDGVETGGVAMYLNEAEKGNVNLFI